MNNETLQSGLKTHCNRPICRCGLTLHAAAVEISSSCGNKRFGLCLAHVISGFMHGSRIALARSALDHRERVQRAKSCWLPSLFPNYMAVTATAY